MKYFRVTFVSQKTMHPLGQVCLEHAVAAETKAAAKAEALVFLRREDDANCMYYKAPRLEEITAQRYAELTQSGEAESTASDTDLHLACLAIFGEQESYDEDELRDAADLLAMPEDEPELYAAYLALRAELAVDNDSHLSTESADNPVENCVAISAEPQAAANVITLVKKEAKKDTRSTLFWQQYPPVAGKVLDGDGLTTERLNNLLTTIQPGESLLLTGLPNEVYHAADGYSSTQIRLALEGGMSALAWYKNAPCRKEESPALALGTAVHTALLEPMRFAEEYVCAPTVNMRTTEGKETWAAFEADCKNLGLTGMKHEDFDQVTLMRDSAMAWPVVRELLSDGVAELSIFWRTPGGVLLKVRPDWLGRYAGVPFLLDIKTTDDVADFGKSVEKFGYHVQAAFYSYVVSRLSLIHI